MDHAARIDKVRQQLDELNVDALYVTDLSNVRYLTGFSGSAGQVLVTSDSAHFYSDRRYKLRAEALVSGAEIDIYADRPTDTLSPQLQASKVARLGVEGKTMTLGSADDLRGRLDGVELVTTAGVVESLRAVKDAEEIEAIRTSVGVADQAFAYIIERLEPGRAEAELALEIEIWMRSNGAEAVSFDPIVGSGPLSAHIHHSPSDRTLAKGDLVLMDFGARVDGYCSDLSRTVVLGAASDEKLAQYSLVLAAQAAGIAALRDGISGREVDAAARKLIDEAGHGERFAHGLGHGVGLDIHEEPRMGLTSDDIMRTGHVVTVEPGVYLPDSGGVRIEDCVAVTASGSEVLTAAPKDDLLEL